MTITDQVLEVCTLRPGPWPAAPKTCVWCATPLTGRQRRWCTGGCEQEFARQHRWQSARAAAIERDGGRCVTCGSDPAPPELRAWWGFIEAVTGVRRREPYRLARLVLAEALKEVQLEVNHIDGLETLCHRCHVQETARQFGYRTALVHEQQCLDVA